jgi:TPR repeat protein
LGCLFESGERVTKDHAEALRLYRKAADAGCGWAMIELADAISDTRIDLEAKSEIIQLYNKAAESDDPIR